MELWPKDNKFAPLSTFSLLCTLGEATNDTSMMTLFDDFYELTTVFTNKFCFGFYIML